MDDMDLDYSVEEMKGDEKPNKVPNWLLMIFRGVGIILFILIGLLFLFLVRNFTAWVSNPYKPIPSSDEPREPLTIYEIERAFDIMVTNKDIINEELVHNKKKPIIEKVKVEIDKVILAYEPDNTDLATVINSKAPNIERIVRETIAKQSVNDLMSNRTIEIVVKRNIIKELNNFMVGIEQPKIEKGKPIFLDKVLKENDRVFIIDIDKNL
jgi:flagellar basal body-associated protein FliL